MERVWILALHDYTLVKTIRIKRILARIILVIKTKKGLSKFFKVEVILEMNIHKKDSFSRR